MSGEEWHAGDGMDPEVPITENHEVDEEEPAEAEEYEDLEYDPHEFAVEPGGSECITCGEFYAAGNHTN